MNTIDHAARRARALFESGDYYCAESVLLAIAAHQGIESALLPQIATGFCSGMARTCGLCGAVSGAVMGLGLVNGRQKPGDDRAANYDVVRAFLAAFSARHGSTNCFELTDCDLDTPAGQQKFRDENVAARCADYVEQAVQLALDAVSANTERVV